MKKAMREKRSRKELHKKQRTTLKINKRYIDVKIGRKKKTIFFIEIVQ